MSPPHPLLAALLFFLFVAGCASTQESADAPETGAHVAFQDLKATPDAYRGKAVHFGGAVLSAKRLKDGTRIEILQLPLDRSGSPGFDLTQSQGRFVAMHKDFLDPATLPYGTRVTVTGDVTGTITLPLDETVYVYPVIEARHLRVWTGTDDGTTRYKPYLGPYWSPYWHPYWRPWPYW